jgi:hypothetical protein
MVFPHSANQARPTTLRVVLWDANIDQFCRRFSAHPNRRLLAPLRGTRVFKMVDFPDSAIASTVLSMLFRHAAS